ncbi:MAG: AraC family transcriptional regulator [Cyclobacteriaceae bacterium]
MGSINNIHIQDGIGVYYQNLRSTEIHSHHATELILSLGKEFQVLDESKCLFEGRLVYIPSNKKHLFRNEKNISPVFIFIEPFHHLAQELRVHLGNSKEIKVVDVPSSLDINRIRERLYGSPANMRSIVFEIVFSLTGSRAKLHQVDDRIMNSIDYIKKSPRTNYKIAEVANVVHLSESRFAHLFKDHVGIPFRKYLIWLRIQTALESILEGRSLTRSGYVAGFADLSHFSRNFKNMFGVTPSKVFKG